MINEVNPFLVKGIGKSDEFLKNGFLFLLRQITYSSESKIVIQLAANIVTSC